MTRAEAIVDRFDEGAKQNSHMASACLTFFLACHYHNTKHVHVPLLQHKTCARIVVTIQKIYIRTTLTTQNMYANLYKNTQHTRVLIGTAYN
jgi:hypothetical protein